MKKLSFSINRKGLQWQLMTRFFLILAVLLLLFGISQYVSMKHYLLFDKYGSLQSKLHSINDRFLESLDSDDNDKGSSFIIKQFVDRDTGVAVVDRNGNIIDASDMGENGPKQNNAASRKDGGRNESIYNSVPRLSRDEYLQLLDPNVRHEMRYKLVTDHNGVLHMVVWRKTGSIMSPTGLVQLSSPLTTINNILFRQILIYLVGLLLIMVIGSLLAGVVFRRTLNPLYNMTKTVQGITAGKLSTRLSEDNGIMEIDRLSISFNKMLNGIEKSFQNEQDMREKMRQFVSDASHELRTPLTSIHGFVEVLLRGAAKSEEQLNSALKSILLESERLTKLVQDLLTITRLEQRLPIEMKVEDINAVINEIYPQLQILAAERKIRLELEDDMTARINRDQMKQVIFNLTQNAVQYTSKNSGMIMISTNSEQIAGERYVSLTIKDNGEGISESNINKIFDRFFRSEFHRSREHGGYGLGLSIVKSIVEAHGGKISVQSSPGNGAEFTIHLPMQ